MFSPTPAAAAHTPCSPASSSFSPDTKRFAQSVGEEAPVVRRRITSLREQLDKPQLVANVDNYSDPDGVIAYLEEKEQHVTAIKERATQLEEYQVRPLPPASTPPTHTHPSPS